MITLIRPLRTVAIVAAVATALAVPRLASAAKAFTSLTITPATTNITAGVANTISTTVSAVNGSGGSSVNAGTPCQFSISILPSDPTVTASLTVTNFTAAKPGTQNTTLTVSTTSLTPSNTYIVSIVVSSNPPNSVLVTPITNTFTVTMASAAPFTPVMVWNPAGANTNWSVASNWSPPGPPGASNDVFFYDIGAAGVAGTVDNTVDSNFTIGSLTYGQTNNFHTTLIASGKTLTLVDTNGLAVGTGADNGGSQITEAAITGAGGVLVVSNLNANVNITQASPSTSPSGAEAELDLSGLGTFNAMISRLLVGVDSVLKGDNGMLNLAATNIITMTVGSALPQIDVGESSQAGADSANNLNFLVLGQTNAFFVDSISVGRGRITKASMLFNSAFSSPAAYFRGTNGSASRVGTWSVGDGFNGKVSGSQANGTNDFSLGTVDALVNTMFIGAGSTAPSASATAGNGTLTVNAGTINVNTLVVGMTTTNSGPGTGMVNMTGGSLVVNTNLALANCAVGANISSATLNISSATVTANNGIIAGAGTSMINLTGSTLNFTNSIAAVGTSNNPVSNFAITNSILNLALRSGAPSVVTANLAAGGTASTINISAVPLLTGFPAQFPIVQYGMNGGSASGDLTTFVLGTLPSASPTPYGAYLSNNVANNSIDLVFTNGPFVPALVWDGTNNGNWDISTTANWRPNSGPDSVYIDTSFVTFDDTLRGTAHVNLTTNLIPGSVTMNNSATNYTFSGTGKISGATGLNMQGAGALVLDNSGTNDFTGGVSIASGTLQIGNNDANGNLPLGSVVDNGALVFNRSNNITVLSTISGAGTLTQNDTNILTLGGSNSLAGGIFVAQGTLQTGNTNALGLATNVIVSSGATLDVNGQALFGNGSVPPVTVSGTGVGGNGAIVNSNTNQIRVLHIVTLTTDTTFGGNGNWDIHNSSGKNAVADAQLNGAFNLTKTGTNTVSLTGVIIDGNLGDINVQAGSMTVTATATAPVGSLGNALNTVTIFSNATFTLDSIGSVPSKNFTLTNGGTLKCTGTNTVGSPITLVGAANNAFTVNTNALFTITSVISGSGGFAKNGSSSLFLTTANTYGGSTVVSGGILALYGNGSDGSIASSTNINITSGAIIDVSGRSDGTFTLSSGQTLIGGAYGTNIPPIAGAINGALIISSGAILSPGTGFATTNETVGTIGISSNLLLQGTTIMDVSATNGYDQIDAATITYGGALVVSNNFSGIITNDQAFQLFVASNGVYNTGSFSSVALPTVTGVTWTNTLSSNGTITAGIAGSGPAAQPHITSVSLSGTSLVISGTNGTAGRQFYVLTTTNLALPLSQWTTNTTGTFNSGNFNITNTVNPSDPHNFYILQVP